MQYEYQGVVISLSIYTLQTWSIDIEINQRKSYHRTSCRVDTPVDFIPPYQIIQTIGNSAECGDDFGSVYFICNMSRNELR